MGAQYQAVNINAQVEDDTARTNWRRFTVIGVWSRTAAWFSNSKAYFLEIVAMIATGASALNTAPIAAFRVFASGPETLRSNLPMAEVVIAKSISALAPNDAYVTSFLKAGLV